MLIRNEAMKWQMIRIFPQLNNGVTFVHYVYVFIEVLRLLCL